MQHRLLILLFIIFSKTTFVFGQLNAVVTGDAIDLGNNCYTITPDGFFFAGGVWYDNPIDFDSDFTIFYQNYFGNKDLDGADGMALVFKGNPTAVIGNAGGGVGYEGISPSLVIEFDTYQNADLGDPSWDHISIMRNGNPSHNNLASNLAGPIQASATSLNVEDGATHEVKIEWIAATNILNVYFDCQLRLSLNQNVKNTIFSGDDTVYFGFVGSTGGLSNLHQVCFNSISFVDNLQLEDEIICDIGSVQVDATIPSGDSYSWFPLDGVSDPNSPDPFLSPTNTTTYSVTISDICGETTTEEVTVFVFTTTTPVFDQVTPICVGEVINPLPQTSNNGITGTWTPALNNTSTTTYTFIPDPDQCADLVTMEIIVNPLQIPFFDAIDDVCEGETISALPTSSINGITGSWSPALNNLATTTYTFTPDVGQSCAQQATLEIVIIPLENPIFDTLAPICEGDSLEELPTISNNGITGSWSPTLNNLATTTYTFTPNTNECANITTLEIIVEPNETPVFDAIDPICQGDALANLPLVSNNGITGVWTPTMNNMATTTYTFTPSEGQCAVSTTLEIVVSPTIVPVFDAVIPICPGEPLQELPTTSINGISGEWSPALDNTQTTEYTFTPDTGKGCTIPTTLEIVVVNPVVAIFDDINAICVGDSIGALPTTSNNGISGSWSPELNNLATTTYTFTPDAGQCSEDTTLQIEVIPLNDLSIEVEVISEAFSNNQVVVVSVSGGTGSYEYKLDNGPWVEENSFNRVSGCEEHIVRVREVTGCSNIAEETFRILEYPKYFTPNGDTMNDLWNIDCLRDQAGASISIFDRYGKLLTVLNPSRFGWDGSYNDTLMPSDDYWFKVEYVDENGLPSVFMSHFTLKR